MRATSPAEIIQCDLLIIIISGEDNNLKKIFFYNLCLMFKFWCVTGVGLGVRGDASDEAAPGGRVEVVDNMMSKQIF
jgi:hypothetical protein